MKSENLAASPCRPLEMWGGVECTVNRVGEIFLDQSERNGHARRTSDLDLFAGLGVRAIRYPVLWERTAPKSFENIDWSWADERVNRLRELGLRPIIGLVHHGSGPRHTSLVEDNFATGLAEFASLVAERYPWIEDYTPVNEPLTTARFSGLYGHWYPHGQDVETFARALFNQCRAVALSMEAIRRVNPHARLIQTDDLGKIFSTPLLEYEAEFENERRWLTFDLLCGRILNDHPMWNYLRKWGLSEAEILWFAEHPCPPDILGINHYLTSNRHLDENMVAYPEWSHGGNERHDYADVEAVRADVDYPVGIEPLLAEAWERYHLPIAITESHLGCTREEQLRWLKEGWDAAETLRGRGADIRAVTAWSLLGAYDWDSLVTRENNFYEPGVFDLRSPKPRPTAIARLVRELASGKSEHHPVLNSPGWWRRDDRFFYPVAHGRSYEVRPTESNTDMRDAAPRPLIITGATGTLGGAFARLCDVRGIPYHILTRDEMNIHDSYSVDRMLEETKPWAIINCAGYVRVDDAEHDESECLRVNTSGPALLAAACARHDVSLLAFSSDLVFGGGKSESGEPYLESEDLAPLGVYGHSKAEMERRVLEILPGALIVRTSAFFGPWDEHNFVTHALRALTAGEAFAAADDQIISPTYVVDLVHAALDLLIDGERGVWHLVNQGAVTWAEFARRAAELAGITSGEIIPSPTGSMNSAATRPRFSALASERGTLLPPLDDALGRYLRHREAHTTAQLMSGDGKLSGGARWNYQFIGSWI